MSNEVKDHGFLNAVKATNDENGNVIRVNALFNNGNEKFPSSVNVVAFGEAAKEIAALEKGTRVYVAGRFAAESYEKEGQRHIGSTNIIIDKTVAAIPFNKEAENTQPQLTKLSGVLSKLNELGDAGVSGVLSFKTGKEGAEKFHNVSFVAFNDDIVDFLKHMEKGDIIEASGTANGSTDKEGKLRDTSLLISRDVSRLQAKTEQGYQAAPLSLAEFKASQDQEQDNGPR